MPSFIIVGYVQQILGRGPVCPTPPLSVNSPKKPFLNRVNNIDSDIFTLFSDVMGLITIDLNSSNLDDDNFDEDDLTNFSPGRLIA